MINLKGLANSSNSPAAGRTFLYIRMRAVMNGRRSCMGGQCREGTMGMLASSPIQTHAATVG